MDTITSANKFVKSLSNLSNSSSSSTRQLGEEDIEALLVNRHSQMRHLLILDSALGNFMGDKIMRAREDGSFAGVAFATDESPPDQPRFRGLRFQITVLYVGLFDPLPAWENSLVPPISSTSLLADIMHCPGKKGIDVSRILEKQVSRHSCNVFDIPAGVGDGGGENEGPSGVHAYFENLNPGYVRRR